MKPTLTEKPLRPDTHASENNFQPINRVAVVQGKCGDVLRLPVVLVNNSPLTNGNVEILEILERRFR